MRHSWDSATRFFNCLVNQILIYDEKTGNIATTTLPIYIRYEARVRRVIICEANDLGIRDTGGWLYHLRFLGKGLHLLHITRSLYARDHIILGRLNSLLCILSLNHSFLRRGLERLDLNGLGL